MTSLRRMIGMPVVWEGMTLGYVERGILTQSARKLQGLIVRRGLGSARWIPRKLIVVVGSACVVVCGESLKTPKAPELTLSRAYSTTGQCVGQVTDAVVDGETLRIVALEVSSGPLYHLMGQRNYAMEYSVRQEEPYPYKNALPSEIVVSGLCTWAQVMGQEGKEEEP